MAISEMRKIQLVAMSYDRDNVLNILHKSGACELKTQTEFENTTPLNVSNEVLTEKIQKAENALNFLSVQIDNYQKENKIKSSVLTDGFDVGYADFMAMGEKLEETETLVEKVLTLSDEINRLNNEKNAIEKELKNSKLYSCQETEFSKYVDTQHCVVSLGEIPTKNVEKLQAEDRVCFEILNSQDDTSLILTIYLKEEKKELENVLSECGYEKTSYSGDISGKDVYEKNVKAFEETKEKIKENLNKVIDFSNDVKTVKTYVDYLGFIKEKDVVSENMRSTNSTVLMEGYVPLEATEALKVSLDSSELNLFFEFSEPDEDEIPPTLMKNNAVVRNFEAVTNMYAPPNSKEFDPNTVMGIFYSIFLGFIMADVGYGLIMLLGGGALWLKIKRETGMKKLAGVFALGGICAIIWGFLFNSYLGLALTPNSILPNAQKDSWDFIGIKVPAVLLMSLLLGVVQLGTGYACLAVQHFRRGKVLDGICEGIFWTTFSIGVGLVIVGFTTEFNLPALKKIGAITAGASLLLAVLTAGRHEKFFGKFTKGFSSVYGVINYASDILSYARLYGLMLSGVVIAQIVSEFSVNHLILSGNVLFIVFGVLLMLIGHIFNLAIGLLGAYIHDARLQYVEFYGKFFEGEGELFAPLGSSQKYIYLTR